MTCLWYDPNYRWNPEFLYGPEHVNRLYRGFKRNTTIPFEFVVITDHDPRAFDPGIRVIPIWDDLRDMGGCYLRLKMFSREMRAVIGARFVQVDLDSVVVGNMDPLLSRTEPFIAWQNIHPPTPYCGSMFMMDAGAREQVWTAFDRDKTPALGRELNYVGTDQASIGALLGPNEAVWTADDGVLSYRKHCAMQCRGGLPDHARIVFFHGKVDPSQPHLQERSPWIKQHWI